MWVSVCQFPSLIYLSWCFGSIYLYMLLTPFVTYVISFGGTNGREWYNDVWSYDPVKNT